MSQVKLEVYQTGGGCTAWRGDIPGTGLYVLITQDLSHQLDPELPIEVGIYEKLFGTDLDDECLGYFEIDLDTMK